MRSAFLTTALGFDAYVISKLMKQKCAFLILINIF